MKRSRREFLVKSALVAAGTSFAGVPAFALPLSKLKHVPINIFSKCLQWLDYDEMATVVRELGFDGIELTVRPQGHVSPESVATDLPKAVSAARRAGLDVNMIVTAISDAAEPHTGMILRTASEHGVKSYRLNWFNYDNNLSVDANIRAYVDKFKALEKLNRQYNLRAEYQNHQGQHFGSAIWDLWMAIKDFDPAYIAIQFDAFHAAVEGFNTWPSEFRMVKSHIGSLAIKDFGWKKNDGRWSPDVVPLGEGAVDYNRYAKLIKEAALRVPFTIHYEYPLGGAEHGARKLTAPRDEVLTAMKRDLVKLKSLLD